MSMCLPYICLYWALAVALLLSLVSLGVRDIVRGLASRNWSTVARGVGLLVAAVVTIVVSYELWIWFTGPAVKAARPWAARFDTSFDRGLRPHSGLLSMLGWCGCRAVNIPEREKAS